MPKVVEAQILNSEKATGPRECSANAIGVESEDVFACLGLRHGERPALWRVPKPPVVPILDRRVLGIPDHTCPCDLLVVAPFQAAYFRFPPG
jgi:hypothetical protein